MTGTRHVMTLTISIPGMGNPIQEIAEHLAVRRYLDAGWAFASSGTVVKGKAATVPLIAPDDWPTCLEGRT